MFSIIARSWLASSSGNDCSISSVSLKVFSLNPARFNIGISDIGISKPGLGIFNPDIRNVSLHRTHSIFFLDTIEKP